MEPDLRPWNLQPPNSTSKRFRHDKDYRRDANLRGLLHGNAFAVAPGQTPAMSKHEVCNTLTIQ